MPMYEYECESCKKGFEKLVRAMSSMKDDKSKVACPECGSTRTHRKHSIIAAVHSGGKPEPAPGGCGRCGGPGPCAFD
ncbi:MAG: zinc ribbon domain-containing protein [Tepidisphaeraceae bacterium]